MLFKNKVILVTTFLLSLHIVSANALGLGEIRVKSYINQPLSAEVDLIDLRGVSTEEVLPALASSAAFAQVGIERNAYLLTLEFTPVITSSRGYVRITSREPVREPFLNFLMEIAWPSGRLLREFTLFIDPPVFDKQAPVPAYQLPYMSSSDRAFSDYNVRRGDTLAKIVRRIMPGTDPNQAMLAMQRANPHAFIKGNINLLKTGAILRMPSAELIAQTSPRQALNAIRSQSKQIRTKVQDATRRQKADSAPSVSSGPTMQLTSPGGGFGNMDSGSGDSSSKISSLQEQIDTLRRQNDSLEKERDMLQEMMKNLQIQNDRLKRLEDNVRERDSDPPEEDEESNFDVSQAHDSSNQTEQPELAASGYPEYDGNQEHSKELTDDFAESASAPMPKGIIGTLLDNLFMIAGLGLLLLAAIGWFAFKQWQERQAVSIDDDEEYGEDSEKSVDNILESSVNQHVSMVEVHNESSEIATILDDVDALIAYKYFPQAIYNLEDAIATHGENPSLMMKLLSVYANMKDETNFIGTANSLVANNPDMSSQVNSLAKSFDMPTVTAVAAAVDQVLTLNNSNTNLDTDTNQDLPLDALDDISLNADIPDLSLDTNEHDASLDSEIYGVDLDIDTNLDEFLDDTTGSDNSDLDNSFSTDFDVSLSLDINSNNSMSGDVDNTDFDTDINIDTNSEMLPDLGIDIDTDDFDTMQSNSDMDFSVDVDMGFNADLDNNDFIFDEPNNSDVIENFDIDANVDMSFDLEFQDASSNVDFDVAAEDSSLFTDEDAGISIEDAFAVHTDSNLDNVFDFDTDAESSDLSFYDNTSSNMDFAKGEHFEFASDDSDFETDIFDFDSDEVAISANMNMDLDQEFIADSNVDGFEVSSEDTDFFPQSNSEQEIKSKVIDTHDSLLLQGDINNIAAVDVSLEADLITDEEATLVDGVEADYNLHAASLDVNEHIDNDYISMEGFAHVPVDIQQEININQNLAEQKHDYVEDYTDIKLTDKIQEVSDTDNQNIKTARTSIDSSDMNIGLDVSSDGDFVVSIGKDEYSDSIIDDEDSLIIKKDIEDSSTGFDMSLSLNVADAGDIGFKELNIPVEHEYDCHDVLITQQLQDTQGLDVGIDFNISTSIDTNETIISTVAQEDLPIIIDNTESISKEAEIENIDVADDVTQHKPDDLFDTDFGYNIELINEHTDIVNSISVLDNIETEAEIETDYIYDNNNSIYMNTDNQETLLEFNAVSSYMEHKGDTEELISFDVSGTDNPNEHNFILSTQDDDLNLYNDQDSMISDTGVDTYNSTTIDNTDNLSPDQHIEFLFEKHELGAQDLDLVIDTNPSYEDLAAVSLDVGAHSDVNVDAPAFDIDTTSTNDTMDNNSNHADIHLSSVSDNNSDIEKISNFMEKGDIESAYKIINSIVQNNDSSQFELIKPIISKYQDRINLYLNT